MKLIGLLKTKMHFGKFGTEQLLVLVIALELVGAVGVVAYGFATGSRPMGAELALVQGKVEYRETPDKPWQTAETDMAIQQNMSVRVSGDGRAVIALDDGSAVRLNSDSTVLFSKLTYKYVLLHNDGGQVYTRVAKSDTRVFEVTTSKSTYRSMGTAYRTIDTPDKEGVEVYHSRVSVLGTTNDGIVVKQGERYYQIDKNDPDQTSKVTELDQTAIAADSFIVWNSAEDSKEFRAELGMLFDLKPPALQVSSPANGLATTNDTVDVTGTTETGAKVVVNGATAIMTGNSFSYAVALVPGANAITVEAEDGAGNKTVITVNVTKTTPATAPAATNTFTLRGTKVDKGVSFTWTVSGYDTSKGFKLLMSSAANPTFASSKEKAYIESGSARSYTWKIQDGATYNFRICTYTGSGCAAYSNNIAVATPAKPESASPSGSVTLSHSSGGNVAWVLNGSAPNGYKLVWNTTGSPAYPNNATGATYYGSDATSGTITSNPGTYYVRVGLYKDGTCPIYSNEITVTIP